MEVIILKDKYTAAKLTARVVAKEIQKNPHAVLGLATGRTMELVYDYLAEMYSNNEVDFSECSTFNLDEYVGIAPENKNSYRSYMNERLFNKVNMQLESTHIPIGNAPDLEEESRNYEQTIEDLGGIDFQLLGIGQAGHIGFNEPLSALRSRTRAIALTPETIKQNQTLFENPDEMPRRAITMGVGTILDSKRCLMLVTGFKKAAILKKAVEGPITSMVTATALQLHEHCTVVCDEKASRLLEGKSYYKWIFENEPEWADYQDIAKECHKKKS